MNTIQERLPLHRITREVCEKHGVTLEQIRKRGPKSKSRTKFMCDARNELCYLLYATGLYSLKKIALHIKRQDHSTIIHAINTHLEDTRKQSFLILHNRQWLQTI